MSQRLTEEEMDRGNGNGYSVSPLGTGFRQVGDRLVDLSTVYVSNVRKDICKRCGNKLLYNVYDGGNPSLAKSPGGWADHCQGIEDKWCD
jgi:hypothetical protein|tara:strand:+ start:623 stop:892 length:270 start_codon:yes stop_codon:yes gene_type:complete